MPPLEQNVELSSKKNYLKVSICIVIPIIVIIGIIYYIKLNPTSKVVTNNENLIPESISKNTAVSTVTKKIISCEDFKNLLSLDSINFILGSGSGTMITSSSLNSPDNGKQPMFCNYNWNNLTKEDMVAYNKFFTGKNLPQWTIFEQPPTGASLVKTYNLSNSSSKTLFGSYNIDFTGISMGGKDLSVLSKECSRIIVGSKSIFGTIVKRKIDIVDVGDKQACLIDDGVNKQVYFRKDIGVKEYNSSLPNDQQISQFYSLGVSVDIKYTDQQTIDLAKLLFNRLNEKLSK